MKSIFLHKSKTLTPYSLIFWYFISVCISTFSEKTKQSVQEVLGDQQKLLSFKNGLLDRKVQSHVEIYDRVMIRVNPLNLFNYLPNDMNILCFELIPKKSSNKKLNWNHDPPQDKSIKGRFCFLTIKVEKNISKNWKNICGCLWGILQFPIVLCPIVLNQVPVRPMVRLKKIINTKCHT